MKGSKRAWLCISRIFLFVSWETIAVHPFLQCRHQKSSDSNACLVRRKSQGKRQQWLDTTVIAVNHEEESDYYEVAGATEHNRLSGIPLFLPHDYAKHDALLLWPIPLGHVPESLRTCSIYRSDMARLTPIQKCILTHHQSQLCGFLYNETLGCIAAVTTYEPDDNNVLHYRGESLFRIVDYETKVPFPVATVELIESSLETDEMESKAVEQELVKLKTFLLDYSQLQIETAQEPKSPLEVSLLEDLTTIPPLGELQAAQERRTVIEAAPLKYLVDLALDLVVGCTNEQRCALMLETNSLAAKVKCACALVQKRLAMERARKMANSVTDAVDASVKELKVGPPQLPPWANQIRSGTRLEYFWNVEIGWCSGTVTDNPIRIVDEWIISVKFDDDGSIHRLPLSADDKLRWRPL